MGFKFLNITILVENRYVLGFIKYVMLNEDISPHLGFSLQNLNLIIQQNLMV